MSSTLRETAWRIKWGFFLLFFFLIELFSAVAWAEGEGLDLPEAVNRKIPLEGLSGIHLFFAKLYNNDLILYAIVCTVLMAIVGMAIALAADFALKIMGLHTERIEHRE